MTYKIKNPKVKEKSYVIDNSKNWKQLGKSGYIEFANYNGKDLITIGKTKKEAWKFLPSKHKIWGLYIWNKNDEVTKNKFFKTKKEAIDWAKQYMKKN